MPSTEYIGNGYGSASPQDSICPLAMCPLDIGCLANACATAACGNNVCGVDALNRINVLFVRTHDLLLDGGTTIDEDGRYHFRWELFDSWIDFFMEHAQVKLFAGYHLVVQTEGKDVYMIDKNAQGGYEIVISPIGDEKTERWMEQFLTALYAHLEEKGMKERWYQHIEDEPAEAESWRYARVNSRI